MLPGVISCLLGNTTRAPVGRAPTSLLGVKAIRLNEVLFPFEEKQFNMCKTLNAQLTPNCHAVCFVP